MRALNRIFESENSKAFNNNKSVIHQPPVNIMIDKSNDTVKRSSNVIRFYPQNK